MNRVGPSYNPQPFFVFPWQKALLLICCVPLIIGGLLGHHFLGLLEERQAQDALQSLSNTGETLLMKSQPETFFQSRFAAFADKFYAQGPRREDLPYWIALAKREWQVPFESYAFSPEGRLTQTSAGIQPGETVSAANGPGVREFSPEFLQTCWDFLRGHPRVRGKESGIIRESLNRVFGVNFELHRLEKRRNLAFPIRSPRGDGLIFWAKSPASPFGGLLFIVWNIPPAKTLFQSHIRHKGAGSLTFYALNPFGETESLSDSKEDLATHLFLLHTFLFAKQRSECGPEAIWQALEFDSGLLIIRQPGQGSLWGLWKIILILLTLSGCRFIFWLGNRLFSNEKFYFPIRRKILVIFLFALFFPLLELTYLGQRALLTREQALILDFQKSARDALFAVDNECVQAKNSFGRIARSFRNHPLMASDPQQLAAPALRLRGQRQLTRFEIRSPGGAILALADNMLSFRRNQAYIDVMAEMCMERYIGDRLLSAPRPPPNQVQLIARMLLESPEMGMASLLDRRDQVHELMIGHYHDFLYWDVFPDHDHPAGYLTLTHHMPFVFDQYLEKRVRVSAKQRFSLIARKDETGKWFPATVKPNLALRRFMEKIRITRQTAVGRLTWKGVSWQVVGIPGKNLERRSLAILQPEARILAGLENLRAWLKYGCLATLLSAVFISLMIAELFLFPIRQLQSGMKALKDRNPDLRIPEGNPDELGLARTFNSLMSGLGDVNLGRQIQESLFPANPLHMGPYHVHGLTRPATQLGGDYFDYQVIGPDQILVLVGDVTGHGIPAAILMALSKSVISSMAREQRFSAWEILEELNRIIFLAMKKQLFMTAAFYSVNTRTHEGTLFIFGHPSPFHQTQRGSMSMIDAVGFVMGMRDKPRITPLPFSLQPGERLFLYTDGLAESLETAETENAFDTLMQYAGNRPRLAIAEAPLDFLDHHPHIARGLPQPDDFTVVILERDPAG